MCAAFFFFNAVEACATGTKHVPTGLCASVLLTLDYHKPFCLLCDFTHACADSGVLVSHMQKRIGHRQAFARTTPAAESRL